MYISEANSETEQNSKTRKLILLLIDNSKEHTAHAFEWR